MPCGDTNMFSSFSHRAHVKWWWGLLLIESGGGALKTIVAFRPLKSKNIPRFKAGIQTIIARTAGRIMASTGIPGTFSGPGGPRRRQMGT
jgi:hypothetical protein